jgi:hypothetical protein
VSQVTLAQNRSLHFLDNHSVLLASPLQQTRPRQNNVAKGYGATRLSPPQRKKLPTPRLSTLTETGLRGWGRTRNQKCRRKLSL